MEAGKKQIISVAGEVIERIPTLTEATTKWLDQYQKGRFEVTVDTSALSKEVTKLTHLGREIVIAVLLVGMLVGSAIATYGIAAAHLEGGVWDLLSRIAPFGFVVALVLSFLIVARLTWRWFRGSSQRRTESRVPAAQRQGQDPLRRLQRRCLRNCHHAARAGAPHPERQGASGQRAG